MTPDLCVYLVGVSVDSWLLEQFKKYQYCHQWSPKKWYSWHRCHSCSSSPVLPSFSVTSILHSIYLPYLYSVCFTSVNTHSMIWNGAASPSDTLTLRRNNRGQRKGGDRMRAGWVCLVHLRPVEISLKNVSCFFILRTAREGEVMERQTLGLVNCQASSYTTSSHLFPPLISLPAPLHLHSDTYSTYRHHFWLLN